MRKYIPSSYMPFFAISLYLSIDLGNLFWPLVMVRLLLFLLPLENLQYKSSRSVLNLGNTILFVRVLQSD